MGHPDINDNNVIKMPFFGPLTLQSPQLVEKADPGDERPNITCTQCFSDCPDGFTKYGNGHWKNSCYKIIRRASWEDAQEECMLLGKYIPLLYSRFWPNHPDHYLQLIPMVLALPVLCKCYVDYFCVHVVKSYCATQLQKCLDSNPLHPNFPIWIVGCNSLSGKH